ncbi:RNA methyltransferase [bacterium]|nr:RNA methyltransferase [bacterium]
MIITSSSNEKVKRLKALYKDKKLRLSNGVYVAEGENFVKDIPADGCVKALYIRENSYQKLNYLEEKFDIEALIIKDSVFDAIADTVTPSGVIAEVAINKASEVMGDFVLVLDGVSDAGNLGAILRTACAVGITQVICIDTVDPYSPKAVRASMGGINKLNIVAMDTDKVLFMLQDYDIISLATGSKNIFEYKTKNKVALVIGNEAHGIQDRIVNASKAVLTIPMKQGSVESLNAAVSAGIAMYALIK